MTRLCATLVLVTALAAAAAPAPRAERGAPPLTPDSATRLEPVGEIPIDGWELVWGPKPGELTILQWMAHVDVLDAKTFKNLRRIAPDRKLTHVAYSPRGELMALSDHGTNRVEITELKTGKSKSIDAGGGQASLDFSPDGKYLATGVYGRKATLWNADTGEKVREFATDADGGLRVVFTRDGEKLALSNRNSTTSIYEVKTGKLLHVLDKKMTQEVQFNPAGTILACGYVDGRLGLWDVATGQSLYETDSKLKEVYSVDWSPKGDLLVTSGLNGKTVVWDPKELRPLKELDAPDWVIQVRFSPDGLRLFTAGGTQAQSPERKVTIWGVRDRGGN